MNAEQAKKRSAGFRRLAGAAFWVLFVVITVFALYPRLSLPEPELTRGSTPYYNHVLAFMVLLIAGSIAWGLGRALVVGLGIYAVALEAAQSLSPGRETAIDDLVASFGGLAFGYTMVVLFRSALRQFDRRIAALR